MLDVICDTSSIQYLYQLELLHIIPKLANQVFVPSAVVEEVMTTGPAGGLLKAL